MDSKVIVLLVFILFAIVVSFMVGNGMIDLTSIYERVTKSQAEQGLGGVKLQIVSPVPSVYYEADSNNQLDLGGILKIAGQNLKDKVLTISVASPHWKLDLQSATAQDNGGTVTYGTYSSIASGKTIQVQFGKELELNGNVWMIKGESTSPQAGDTAYKLLLERVDTNTAPFQMPEFVELVFAVGETAKAEVTIVVEPSA